MIGDANPWVERSGGRGEAGRQLGTEKPKQLKWDASTMARGKAAPGTPDRQQKSVTAKRRRGPALVPSEAQELDGSDPANIELVFGFVGPTGIDLDKVYEALRTQLRIMQYDVVEIRLSDLITEYLGKTHKFRNGYERIKTLMERGPLQEAGLWRDVQPEVTGCRRAVGACDGHPQGELRAGPDQQAQQQQGGLLRDRGCALQLPMQGARDGAGVR